MSRVPPGSESTATAPCPLGTKAVGGGFSVAPPTMDDGLLVDRSMRGPGESWTVRANRLDGSGAATALAYCRATKKAILDVPASASVAPAGGGRRSRDRDLPGGLEADRRWLRVNQGTRELPPSRDPRRA